MSSFERAFIRWQFNAKVRTRVYRKLVRFLENSMAIAQALDVMHQHASEDGKKPKAAVAIVLDHWRREVRNGKAFGKAIEGWVPESDRIVIEGGDRAGKLIVAINKAILISESSRKIKGTLIGGLAYPALLIVVAIGFLVMFGLQVVPAFEEILPREKWVGAGAQMAFMSDFVRYYMVWFLIFIGGLIFGSIYSLPRWTGHTRAKFDKYPPWSLYRLILGSGFLLTVSGMIKAGIAAPEILRILQRNASPWYKEKLSKTLDNVNNGHNLGDALHLTGFEFPAKETVQDLRAYASLNRFDETLEAIGTEWLSESVAMIDAQTAIFRNIAFLILGGVFMWIAGGIFSLQQQITSSL
jgi:type II secretory pathway component PulF